MAKNIVSLPRNTSANDDTEAGHTVTQAEELPPLESVTVPSALLRAALLIAAKKDVRYYLNGVFIRAVDDSLHVVGTDGHRILVTAIKVKNPPAWTTAGVIISREWLAESLGLLDKIGHDVLVSFGVGHSKVYISDPTDTFRMRIDAIDGKFPDYDRILHSSSGALAGEVRPALDSTTINPQYLKDAATVAGLLGSKSTTPFVGSSETAMMFTFGAGVDTDVGISAVMYVMPMREDHKVSESTLALIGPGLKQSIAALKAWRSRLVSQLNVANTDKQREELRGKMQLAEHRLANLTGITTKAIAAPTEKAA